MKLEMIRLGRMGSNMVRRLLGSGQQCVVFDIHPQASVDLAKAGATAARSLADRIARLETPLAALLAARAGIVEHGLFLGIATDVLVGSGGGVRHLSRHGPAVQP